MNTAVPDFESGLAEACRQYKRAFVVHNGEPDEDHRIRQTGGAHLGPSFPLPVLTAEAAGRSPSIDLFICSRDGSCRATGSDAVLIEFWQEAAQLLAETVFGAAAAAGVDVADEAYVTASLTPVDQVTTDAHLDDDRYEPNDGVGLVAIVGSLAGPRLSVGTVPTARPTPGLPLAVADELIHRFTAGQLPHQQCDAERIVIFPQFGQLHAGPVLDRQASSVDTHRRLLVLRIETVSEPQPLIGSGPT